MEKFLFLFKTRISLFRRGGERESEVEGRGELENPRQAPVDSRL